MRARRLGRPRTSRRTRVRVHGTVQGVGFRPYVYRLADELGLAGWVLNDARGVLLEVEGGSERVGEFLDRLAPDAPPLAVVERVEISALAPLGERSFAIRESPRGAAADAPGDTGHGDVRRLPARAVRPPGPPPPVPVHQLHQLRTALHDRARRSLRPTADDDGRIRDVRRLPGGVRRSVGPALSRPAERMP